MTLMPLASMPRPGEATGRFGDAHRALSSGDDASVPAGPSGGTILLVRTDPCACDRWHTARPTG